VSPKQYVLEVLEGVDSGEQAALDRLVEQGRALRTFHAAGEEPVLK